MINMSLYDELPVFKARYDLLLNVFQFTANFKREYKYTVGALARYLDSIRPVNLIGARNQPGALKGALKRGISTFQMLFPIRTGQ
jgi:hypothetical protein